MAFTVSALNWRLDRQSLVWLTLLFVVLAMMCVRDTGRLLLLTFPDDEQAEETPLTAAPDAPEFVERAGPAIGGADSSVNAAIHKTPTARAAHSLPVAGLVPLCKVVENYRQVS